MSIKLLIADDHEVVRCGLRSLVGGSDVEIIGEAVSGEQAVSMVLNAEPGTEPDVVLLDIRMPDGDGLNSLGASETGTPESAHSDVVHLR